MRKIFVVQHTYYPDNEEHAKIEHYILCDQPTNLRFFDDSSWPNISLWFCNEYALVTDAFKKQIWKAIDGSLIPDGIAKIEQYHSEYGLMIDYEFKGVIQGSRTIKVLSIRSPLETDFPDVAKLITPSTVFHE